MFFYNKQTNTAVDYRSVKGVDFNVIILLLNVDIDFVNRFILMI